MAFTVNDVEVIFMPEDRAYREAFGALVCELDAMQEALRRVQKSVGTADGTQAANRMRSSPVWIQKCV